MISFGDFTTDAQDITGDTTSTTLTRFKRWGNQGYQLVLAEFGRPSTERTQTALTVASQQYYTLPPDVLFIKSITVTISSVPYPLEEIHDQKTWNVLNADLTGTSDIPTYYFVRQGFGIGGSEIGIFPKPASASNTITVVYEAGDRDLTQDAITTGTVTVTNGDATITHSGTSFTAAMVGRYFKTTNDGVWYRIASFTDTSNLELENVFEGTTNAAQVYTISEAFNLPEDMQDLPLYFTLQRYYDMRQDSQSSLKYKALFEAGLRDGKRRWIHKSRGNVIHGRPQFRLRSPNFPPENLP